MKTAGEKALENVNNLIESIRLENVSGYKVWQETGVGQDKISKLRSGEIKILNLSAGIFIKLSNFWEENNMFNKLNEHNSTIIEFEGTELRTIDNPYLDDDVYKAIAVDQYDNKYQITWEIIHPDFDELTDESEACDWDKPVEVEKL